MYVCDVCGNDTTTTYYLPCGEIGHACSNSCYTLLMQREDTSHSHDQEAE